MMGKLRLILAILFLLFVCAGCSGKKNFPAVTREEIENARQTADAAVQYVMKKDLVNLYQLYHPTFRETVSLADYGTQFADNIIPFGKIRNPVFRRMKEDSRYFATTIGLRRVLRFYYQVDTTFKDTTFMAEVVSGPSESLLSEIKMTSPAVK